MRVGLLGAGTVGSSLLDLLAQHGPELTDRLGEPIEVAAAVVRDAARPRRLSLPSGARLTGDAGAVVDDPSVAVVVEVMGGVEPARTYALRALRRGASLVTANKALVAACGPELFGAARAGGGDVLFEAAVGASVPVVGAMQRALAAARVEAVAGVLNGSTNYLLARMADGVAFEATVAEARTLGYLEADPSDDVDGHDSARKIAILAALASGRHHAPEAVTRRGLAGVTAEDVAMAGELGLVVKLLAVAERVDGLGAWAVWVAPCALSAASPLASVHGAANAVVVSAQPGGDTLLAGQGAGGPPTAQAVAGDILEAMRRRRAGERGPLVAWAPADDAPAVPMPAYPHLVRVACQAADRPRLGQALARVAGVAAVVDGGAAGLVVRTQPLGSDALEGLASRIGDQQGVESVGVPLVVWSAATEGASDAAWWRVPALMPAAAAARAGGWPA